MYELRLEKLLHPPYSADLASNENTLLSCVGINGFKTKTNERKPKQHYIILDPFM